MRERRLATLAALLLASCVALAACGGSAADSGRSIGNSGGDPRVAGHGCTVQFSGDLAASWKSPQDSNSSATVSYWLSAAERAHTSLAEGEESFFINCRPADQNGIVSIFTAPGTTREQFPFAIGEKAISPGGLLGNYEPGQISVVVSPPDKSAWRVAEGKLTITALTGSRFAGTFQARIEKVSDDLETVIGNATVSGTFDFVCTSGGCG